MSERVLCSDDHFLLLNSKESVLATRTVHCLPYSVLVLKQRDPVHMSAISSHLILYILYPEHEHETCEKQRDDVQ